MLFKQERGDIHGLKTFLVLGSGCNIFGFDRMVGGGWEVDVACIGAELRVLAAYITGYGGVV